MRELLIRADASASLGTGHVMRSLAFAEAAAEAGIPVRFVLGGDGLAVTWVNRRSFDAQYRSDPLDRAWLDSTTEGSVVLVDGLHFADELYASVAESPAHLVVMEDISGIRYADAIVSPETTGDLVHPHRTDALVLTGITHAPLRSEFRERRRLRHRIPSDGMLLVTMGGSDAAGLTRTVTSAVTPPERFGFAGCTVVTGPMAPTLDGFELPSSVSVRRDVEDMSVVYANTDVAVSAAGTGAWELMCMGVPSVFIEVSDNQAFMASAILSAHAGLDIGTWDDSGAALTGALATLRDDAVYRSVSESALAYIDGLGAGRVIAELRGAF